MIDLHTHILRPAQLLEPDLPPLDLLERTDKRTDGKAAPTTLEENEPGKDERILICRACRHPICRVADRVERGGTHVHTFFNPYGVLFEVGIFVSAPGCAVDGQYVSDFTWFPGYKWRIALCGKCWTHLGWHFRAESGDGFWGLILPHLDEAAMPGSDE